MTVSTDVGKVRVGVCRGVVSRRGGVAPRAILRRSESSTLSAHPLSEYRLCCKTCVEKIIENEFRNCCGSRTFEWETHHRRSDQRSPLLENWRIQHWFRKRGMHGLLVCHGYCMSAARMTSVVKISSSSSVHLHPMFIGFSSVRVVSEDFARMSYIAVIIRTFLLVSIMVLW